MSTCCGAVSAGRTPTPAGKIREIFAWVLPSATLVLVPKCPACLAAQLTLWTGLGLSLSTAAYLRWGLLFVCLASLLFLTAKRLGGRCPPRNQLTPANFSPVSKETEPCNTKW